MKLKKNILVYITILLALALVLSSCSVQETPSSGKITSDPAETEDSSYEQITEPEIGAEASLPDYIPVDGLMRSSEFGYPQLSYDGSKIFYRHITDTSDYIEVTDNQTGQVSFVPWPEEAMGIPYFYTAPDNENVILLIDDSGDENFGLYLSNIKDQSSEEILPAGENDCIFLGFDESNDEECYIGLFDFSPEVQNFHIYRFNLDRKTFQPILSNPGNIVTWDFDTQGRLVSVTTIDENASYHVWLKNDFDSTSTDFKESEWTKIITWDYEDADSSGVVMVDDTTNSMLLIDSSIDNLISVVSYDILTGERTIISQDSQGIYDPYGVWIDPYTNEVTGVSYLRERLEWEALDESFGKHLEVLKTVSDGEMNIVDSSQYDEKWIVSFDYDVKSTDFYLYDSATMQAEYLYSSNPALDEYEFAPMEPMSYTSSDGLTIHGYVTFPLNIQRQDLPLVVYVHGGPWSRDTWGFDRDVQFLANRGYMVLQVNFRGSTGYGKEFMLAGDMEWGRKMHQDILDAVDWAVLKGYADPDRVAIYGASYGGYEALVAAAFSPDTFACAIDLFGPSSLLTFVSSQPPQWSSYTQNLYRSIGDPTEDAMLMMERSPYYVAEEITVPLLVVHGGNDIRVKQSESEQLVRAMRRAGIDVEYILFPDAGHGFSTSSQLKTFYEAAEKFLGEHIGGRNEID